MRSQGPALLPIFRSQHQAELLMWLLLHPEEEYGVTELADRVRAPLSTLHREVVRLEAAGLISSRSLGRNRLLRANLGHPASRPLAELLDLSFGRGRPGHAGAKCASAPRRMAEPRTGPGDTTTEARCGIPRTI